MPSAPSFQDAAANVVHGRRAARFSAPCGLPSPRPDFSSYVLQVQNSGAQVLGLANAGNDLPIRYKTGQPVRGHEEDEARRTACFRN